MYNYYTPNINEDHDDYHYHGFGSNDSSLLVIIMVFIIITRVFKLIHHCGLILGDLLFIRTKQVESASQQIQHISSAALRELVVAALVILPEQDHLNGPLTHHSSHAVQQN